MYECIHRYETNYVRLLMLKTLLSDYTVEVTNRFKGLDLIGCLKNYGRRFMTLYRRQ